MPNPVKLYNHALAPNPRRVRIFAAEKGIELALEEIDILAGQSRTPGFLAINSSGAVPVLQLDDGSVDPFGFRHRRLARASSRLAADPWLAQGVRGRLISLC